jgi:hypothetical protein
VVAPEARMNSDSWATLRNDAAKCGELMLCRL